jgi:isocitrate dehydrogenase
VLKSVKYNQSAISIPKYQRKAPAKKELVGVDVFVHWPGSNPDELAAKLNGMVVPGVELTMITNRGIKVWPEGFSETFCTDHWRCRFKPNEQKVLEKEAIIRLLSNALSNQIDAVKTENLYTFEGKDAYSLGQGQ